MLPFEIINEIVMFARPTYPYLDEIKLFAKHKRRYNCYFIVWANTRFRCDRCRERGMAYVYTKNHFYLCRNCFLFVINSGLKI